MCPRHNPCFAADEEVASLAQRSLDDLSDDELALVAEQALKTESESRSSLYNHYQRLALQHLREVVSDLLDESTQPPV